MTEEQFEKLKKELEKLIDASTENIIDAIIVSSIALMASEGVYPKDVYYHYESASYIAGRVKKDLYENGFFRSQDDNETKGVN